MGLNAVGSSLLSPASDTTYQNHLQKRDNGAQLPQNSYAVDARLMSESYSSKSISFEYTSKDGDTVSFSMESVEYSRSLIEVSTEGDKEDVQKVIDYIKDMYDKMKKELLNSFLKSVGVDVPEDQKTGDVEKTAALEIPEYWNAENTSQRIVDFAVSFYGVVEENGDKFLSTIKAAIEAGFKQARELLGELSDEVSALIEDTYVLTMEKMDQWAQGQGITVPDEDEEVIA